MILSKFPRSQFPRRHYTLSDLVKIRHIKHVDFNLSGTLVDYGRQAPNQAIRGLLFKNSDTKHVDHRQLTKEQYASFLKTMHDIYYYHNSPTPFVNKMCYQLKQKGITIGIASEYPKCLTDKILRDLQDSTNFKPDVVRYANSHITYPSRTLKVDSTPLGLASVNCYRAGVLNSSLGMGEFELQALKNRKLRTYNELVQQRVVEFYNVPVHFILSELNDLNTLIESLE